MAGKSTVTLSWEEPVSHFGIADNLVMEALAKGVREHLANSEDFKQQVHESIVIAAKASDSLIKAAIQDIAVQDLKVKIGLQREQLNQYLADLKFWNTQHASDYAQRRYDELTKQMQVIDKA